LTIEFVLCDPKKSGRLPNLKFPKYLKHLQSLTLINIWDKEFTETMFDMASQRRLTSLSLSFLTDLQLPSFSEALAKFTKLKELSLSNVNFSKLN